MQDTPSCPALLIAAPASGQGKTTVVAALARLHARRGHRVQVFKCGPDFIDPCWHELASGRPVHPLDLWITGEADCRARLHRAAQESDLVLVEGVMGLFDGQPSAADLAERFGLPVLAVIDASAMAGTFGALALGLRQYQPALRWAGVLANRVGSARHARMLQDGLREPGEWLGALHRDAAFALPERHLGLMLASELHDATRRLDLMADALEATPLGRMGLDDLQRWSVPPPLAPQPDIPSRLAGRTIAVARDPAFSFVYEANLDTLRALGAELVFFSPLADRALPRCDALWLPGGYPELHGEALAANHAMREAVRAHVAAGRPVWAECGGMMALFESIATRDGRAFPGWGILPGNVAMQGRLAALGPQQLAIGGGLLRGHTFHHSLAVTPLEPVARTARPGEAPVPGAGEAVYRHGPVLASYFHPWFASDPSAAATLFLPGSAA